MNLTRIALTDLLPGVREGFHSAIITTFSFDFYYFEKVLLRRLRSMGVRNVLVLADATMLHQATRFSSGFGASRTKTYNLVPVHCSGAFHPKMLVLVGKKSGWMAIGSGNLTEAGFGKNDEVWGGFYFSETNSTTHRNLFAGGWGFIKSLEQDYIKGFAKKQIEDTEQFAPWLSNLPRLSSSYWSQAEDGSKILLIHSAAGGASIWEQLIRHLPEVGIERITVFSPFFDAKGAMLQKLANRFPSAFLRAIVEPDWGLLPLKLNEALRNRVQFYTWKKLTGISTDSRHHWLHAKIYVFETQLHGCFCFFGSSNASGAGFGLSGDNYEMNLLLHSGSMDFLNKLGVEISEEAFEDLAILGAGTMRKDSPVSSTSTFETYISAAELEDRQLGIWFTKILNKSATLILFDEEGLELQSTEILVDQNEISFKYTGKSEPFACQIFCSETKKALSNCHVVAHLADLRKTNPDPARAKFEAGMDRLKDGENAALTEILPLLDLEKPETSEHMRERGMAFVLEEAEKDPSYSDDLELSEAEFTRIPEDRIYRQNFLHPDPAGDLSDFLLQIRPKIGSSLPETDSDQDEELLDVETGERKDGVTISIRGHQKAETTNNEAEAVRAFLSRYRRALAIATESYLSSVKKNNSPNPLTSTELSHFLIASRLMVCYGDRKDANSQNAMAVFPFRHRVGSAWNPKKIESVQIACFEIIGKMLLLLNSGIRSAMTSQENHRVHLRKEAIFYDALYLFATVLSEKGRDAKYIPLFYHNLMLHFQEFLPVSVEVFTEQMGKRVALGNGVPIEFLDQARKDYQHFEDLFKIKLADKDMKANRLISMGRQGCLILGKQLGVCFCHDKKITMKYHPGGTYDGKNDYVIKW